MPPAVPSCPNNIQDVVLVTRDRTAILARSLDRYLRNTQNSNRPVRFHVFDDAVDVSVLDANDAVIQEASARWRCRISHVSRLDRARWVDQLLREARGAAPEAVVRWGLLGSPGTQIVTGAHRNSIALSLIDRAILCSDDDVAPPVGPMPGRRRGIAFERQREPTEFHFFRSREEAVGAFSRIDACVLALHESLLGRTAAECFAGEGRPLPAALKERPASRVVMTMMGLAGDSGMGSGLYYALLQGPSRTRWTGDFDGFAETREVVRGVRVTTISGASFLMTANVGLDLGAWLPPFVPQGRNQEGPVALALRHINPDSYIGHVPYVLTHEPAGTRASTLAQALDAVRRPRASHVLMMCMSALPRESLEQEIAAERVGRFLVQCTEDPQDFARFVRERAVRFQQARMARIEDVLASRTREPDAWADYVGQLLRAAESAIADPDYPVALDMDGDLPQRRTQLRAYVRQYGELLTVWPALRSAARELRRQDKTLIPS